MKLTWFAFLLICCSLAASATISHANQINYLQMFIKSRQSKNPPCGEEWPELDISREYSPVYVSQKDGSMKADKIDVLPGQPQLAYTILLNNQNTNQTVINLKDIAVCSTRLP